MASVSVLACEVTRRLPWLGLHGSQDTAVGGVSPRLRNASRLISSRAADFYRAWSQSCVMDVSKVVGRSAVVSDLMGSVTATCINLPRCNTCQALE